MKTKRLNNIVFLRIISMYMILVLHYLSFGGFLLEHTGFSISSAIVWFLEALSFVAVNCYVLISGYFLVDAKFKFEKIFKICLQTLFYTLIVYITLLLLNKTDISIMSFIKNCLPITSGTYWFATCYILLYILSPSNISSIELLFNILIVPVIIFICMSLIDKIREYIFNYMYKTQLYSIIEKKMRCLNI